MQDDAFEKLHLGVTTLEEILRVVPIENVVPSECAQCERDLLPLFRFCPYCGFRQDSTSIPSPKSAQLRDSDGVLS